MAKRLFSDDQRHQAMVWYSEGVEIKEMARRFKCHYRTLEHWRDTKDPADWEEFKARARETRTAGALSALRKHAAGLTAEQLEDASKQRKVARVLLMRFVESLQAGREADKDAVDIGRGITRMFVDIQTQENIIRHDPAVERAMLADMDDMKQEILAEQVRRAMAGDVTMLKWLGAVMLGQKEAKSAIQIDVRGVAEKIAAQQGVDVHELIAGATKIASELNEMTQ